MLSAQDIAKSTAKFDQIQAKMNRPHETGLNSLAYQNLTFIKVLGQAKFPVYLVFSQVNKQHYVMKIFSRAGQTYNSYFRNEARFASLEHNNIITQVHHEVNREVIQKGGIQKVSYILMEYAPYGDFYDFIAKLKTQTDEKLIRTYFRQLIEGLEYLHKNGVAHLDLKPENLLIGPDFTLKIIDFDLSYVHGDTKLLSNGTECYRAPEFFRSFSEETFLPFAADIYSAGITLFVLLSQGIYPHTEDNIVDGINYADLLYKDNEKFWATHCEIQEGDASFYTSDFKELFNGMVRLNPSDRLTIDQIKQSRWYNGPIYCPMELHAQMKKICVGSKLVKRCNNRL